LWQAWGVLEAREKDFAAARRCFGRSLDADSRNVPAITAWATMEADLGNIRDARSIFERNLPKFSPGSDEKVSLWRSYELMEQRQANVEAAQQVYQRAIGEAITVNIDSPPVRDKRPTTQTATTDSTISAAGDEKSEVEVSRWVDGGGEVWLNDRAIETKLPFNLKNRKSKI
jgi:tetratricopeptide (TPR) repeat protein